MLKKLVALLLILTLCLSLVACKKDNVQQPGNSETLNQLTVADWQVEAPQYLSYEEYFSTKREYSAVNSFAWTKGDREFILKEQENDLVVLCQKTGERYVVPNGRTYADYTVLGADGRYGYMRNATSFIRMDLATGQPERIGHHDISDYTQFCLRDNTVLYWCWKLNGKVHVGRMYLPTMKCEEFSVEQGELYDLCLNQPTSNLESITWSFINPELVNYLQKELENESSKYKSCEGHDFSEYWQKEDGLTGLLNYAPVLRVAQTDTEIPAYMRYMYDPMTGVLTCQTGFIDNCPEGRDLRHAHYSGEISVLIKPAGG